MAAWTWLSGAGPPPVAHLACPAPVLPGFWPPPPAPRAGAMGFFHDQDREQDQHPSRRHSIRPAHTKREGCVQSVVFAPGDFQKPQQEPSADLPGEMPLARGLSLENVHPHLPPDPHPLCSASPGPLVRVTRMLSSEPALGEAPPATQTSASLGRTLTSAVSPGLCGIIRGTCTETKLAFTQLGEPSLLNPPSHHDVGGRGRVDCGLWP